MVHNYKDDRIEESLIGCVNVSGIFQQSFCSGLVRQAKRRLPAGKGFHIALDDIGPERTFIVYTGDERFPKGKNIEAIGMGDLAKELVAAE